MRPQERYKLDSKPLGEGGYAIVWRATHKETGEVVALKRRRSRDQECVVRLKREIEALRELRNEHIVPILDSSPLWNWYTMPLAEGTLESLRDQLSDSELVQAIQQVGTGLAFAHERGLVHRDVTPRNILGFREQDGRLRWVVADWGLVRRPHGQTSRKVTHRGTGTLEFLAPEGWEDPHTMDKRADIYSLGRVAAWAVNPRKRLTPNRPYIPEGFWKAFVRHTTEMEPEARPGTMIEALDLIQGKGSRSLPLQALVWHEDAQRRLVSSWLEFEGNEVRTLAKYEGVLMCESEHLWKWRTSTRNILLPAQDIEVPPKPKRGVPFQKLGTKIRGILRPASKESGQPQPQWMEKALEDAYLDDVLRGHSQQLSPLYPHRYAEENEYDLERMTVVIGNLGRLLFVVAREYTFRWGAAHGNKVFNFYVLNAESSTRVEALSAQEIEPVFDQERNVAIEHFRTVDGAENSETFSADDVSLTLYRPFYSENGQLMIELQFTAPTGYASSDGQWSSYTHSISSTSSRIPDSLREFMSPPAALARYLAVTCASKRMGWSLVGANPAVRTWLEEMSRPASVVSSEAKV